VREKTETHEEKPPQDNRYGTEDERTGEKNGRFERAEVWLDRAKDGPDDKSPADEGYRDHRESRQLRKVEAWFDLHRSVTFRKPSNDMPLSRQPKITRLSVMSQSAQAAG
jgi:hypothetical protein